MSDAERTPCLFEPTGDRHPATGLMKWRCSRDGCVNASWGDEPASAWCRAGREVIKQKPHIVHTFDNTPCPFGLRGEIVGTVKCGCGSFGATTDVAVCGLPEADGGTGHCTAVTLNGRSDWRRLVNKQPRSCSICAALMKLQRRES